MCYTMYRAARLWVPSQTGAIAGGAFYGLSTMMTWNAWFEIQLALGAVFLPLALEAAVRLVRRPGWRQAVILGVVLGTVLLTDLESSIMTGIVVIAALLPWLVRTASRGGVRAWTKLRLAGLAAAVTAVIASPQLIAMAQQARPATRPCRRAPSRRTTPTLVPPCSRYSPPHRGSALSA